jgi:hypothetical protein
MNIGHHLNREWRGRAIHHRQLPSSWRLENLVAITMGDANEEVKNGDKDKLPLLLDQDPT